jgi:hypothetical protein
VASVFSGALLSFLWHLPRAIRASWIYGEFGDESEAIVVAKMPAAGQALYAEIFNHHGPPSP